MRKLDISYIFILTVLIMYSIHCRNYMHNDIKNTKDIMGVLSKLSIVVEKLVKI